MYHNVKLFNTGTTTWDGATAKVTVASNAVSAVEIIEGGSGYTAETLDIDNSFTGGSGAKVSVVLSGISTNVRDVLQITGIGTVSDNVVSISSIRSSTSVSIAVTTGDPDVVAGQFAINQGPAASITGTPAFDSTVGITTFTTTSGHGLIVGNQFRIVDTSNNNIGNFFVKNVINPTSFSATTTNQLANPSLILRDGMTAATPASDKENENIGSRGLSFYDGETFILGANVTTGTTLQVNLSNVGVGTTVKSFYFDTKQYNDLRSVGLGTHKFNYPPINVEVIGRVGISSIAGKTYDAVVQPIVRGEITSINLTNNGVGYGASEILNFNRKPEVDLYSGKDAVIIPVVANGRIVDVSVSYGGTDYNSPPDLVVLGIGSDAKLTPELNSSGNIVSVNIQSGGIGYGVSTTFVRVDAAGKGIKVEPVIQKWTVNEVSKNLLNLNDDDVFISKPVNSDYGLQCSYAYAPRNLRKISYASDPDGNVSVSHTHLTLPTNREV